MDLASQAALTQFINSLFREWNGWSQDEAGLYVQLQEGLQLRLPARYVSKLGRHSFAFPARLAETEGAGRSLSFEETISIIARHLVEACQWAPGNADAFVARVVKSRDAMAHYLYLRGAPDVEECELDFLAAEQFLFLGHSLHPCPKSREGFSETEELKFAPEFGEAFALHWWAVAPELLHSKHSSSFHEPWIQILFEDEAARAPDLRAAALGRVLFPVHPFQALKLKANPKLASAFAESRIQDLGQGPARWKSTSSVRSFASDSAPYLLKTSLSVRLTNSLRTLQPSEAERGMMVHEVLCSPLGQELLKRHPSFSVQAEPAYAGLIVNGELLVESLIVCRTQAFPNPQGVNVLASLNQEDPASGHTLIGSHLKRAAQASGLDLGTAARRWFAAFAEHTLRPLISAQADYGVLLGAHQQNILLHVEDHWPEGMTFRDCQGTGYLREAAERLQEHIPSMNEANGNIIPETMAITLFCYYLIINAAFNVISSLAKASGLDEDILCADLRAFLLAMRSENPPYPSVLDHLLNAPKILHKGNFVCAFEAINENTAPNPLVIYRPIQNPLSASARTSHV